MSKKHFEAFARAIREGLVSLSLADRKIVAAMVADTCSEFNSAFDRGRFYRACGFEPKKGE